MQSVTAALQSGSEPASSLWLISGNISFSPGKDGETKVDSKSPQSYAKEEPFPPPPQPPHPHPAQSPSSDRTSP